MSYHPFFCNFRNFPAMWVKKDKRKGSIKSKRLKAGWDNRFLTKLLINLALGNGDCYLFITIIVHIANYNRIRSFIELNFYIYTQSYKIIIYHDG